MLGRLVFGRAGVMRQMLQQPVLHGAPAPPTPCVACLLRHHGFATASERKLALRSWQGHLFPEWSGRGSVAAGAGRVRRGQQRHSDPATVVPPNIRVPPDVIVLEQPSADTAPRTEEDVKSSRRIGRARAQTHRSSAAGTAQAASTPVPEDEAAESEAEEASGSASTGRGRRLQPRRSTMADTELAAGPAVLDEELSKAELETELAEAEAASGVAESASGGEGSRQRAASARRRAADPFMSLGVDDRVTVRQTSASCRILGK